MCRETIAVPVVCVIIQRRNKRGETEFLIQSRWKPEADPKYTGIFEIPGGKIKGNETLEEAARREALEETGIEVEVVSGCNQRMAIYEFDSTQSYAFSPLVCTKEIGDHPYIGFFVVSKVKRIVRPPPTKEASQHRWVTKGELLNLISERKIFPIDAPGLLEYLKNHLG